MDASSRRWTATRFAAAPTPWRRTPARSRLVETYDHLAVAIVLSFGPRTGVTHCAVTLTPACRHRTALPRFAKAGVRLATTARTRSADFPMIQSISRRRLFDR